VSSSAHAFGAVPESVYAANIRNADEALFRERMAAHVEGVYGDTKLMQVLTPTSPDLQSFPLTALERLAPYSKSNKEGIPCWIHLTLDPYRP